MAFHIFRRRLVCGQKPPVWLLTHCERAHGFFGVLISPLVSGEQDPTTTKAVMSTL